MHTGKHLMPPLSAFEIHFTFSVVDRWYHLQQTKHRHSPEIRRRGVRSTPGKRDQEQRMRKELLGIHRMVDHLFSPNLA